MYGRCGRRPTAFLDGEALINLFVRGQDRQLWRLRQVTPPETSIPARESRDWHAAVSW